MDVKRQTILECTVLSDWVDYNRHMNDAAYAIVFSMAVDEFVVAIGLDAEARDQLAYTIYTLETHLSYLREAHEEQALRVNLQLLDYDAKRLHVFFNMEDDAGNVIATSEQMLMGIDTNQGRPSPFPASIETKIVEMGSVHNDLGQPKQAGQSIGIRKK